jgi:hypothetical protein
MTMGQKGLDHRLNLVYLIANHDWMLQIQLERHGFRLLATRACG